MAKRYQKPPKRQEVVLSEIPIPKEYQRELVAGLLESAYCKGPDEIMDALKKCVADTDTGKHVRAEGGPVELHDMISKFHDIHGKTALHYACLGRRAANTEYIMKLCPAIVPMKDSDGETALMLAALSGDELTVNAVLHHDKAVNAKNQTGVTALHLAAESGNVSCICRLIEAGAEVNCYSEKTGTPLLYAVMNNNYDAVQELLKKKADPNYPFDLKDLKKPAFPPPLLYACNAREDTIAELLLANKANPNLQDKDAWTALHCAAECGAFRAARALLEAGANTDVITEGLTAFDVAMRNHNWAIADLLKDRTSILKDDHAKWLEGLKAAYKKGLEADHDKKERQTLAAAGFKDEASQKQMEKARELKAEGDAFNQAGDCMLAANKYTEALKMLPDAPAADKERAMLYASRSMMYMGFGDLASAESDANEATKLDPLWSVGYSAKARVYKAKNEWKEYTSHLYEALTREDVRNDELIAELKHAVEMSAKEEGGSK